MTIDLADVSLNWTDSGIGEGAPVVFIQSFGMDLSIWDKALTRLPKGIRPIRFDLRGHGASSCPKGPYSMGALVRDAEQLLDHLNLRDVMLVGLGLGGMIAQGLAVKRLDQVRALVLCNTAAKIGHAPHWQAMIDEVEADGAAPLAERMMPLWFHRAAMRENLHSSVLTTFKETSPQGLAGCLSALKGSDFYTPTSGLRLQTLALAGAEDRMVPPDMTQETGGLIPGSDYRLIRKSGHISPLDQPEIFAQHLTDFVQRTGHV
ncbi:alpha/beta fold hydrolase [Cognatishimia sp. 1_MG-2023]|uniref:alpha/beta fold hydrolase n=1 Tax=Cognatishimia sp. 1_MG-2023 TaxID=3062642 RepID=UPI0034A3101C